MIAAFLAGWITAGTALALLIGRAIAIADRRVLITSAGTFGEEMPRRGLPAYLSPRAGSGTRRALRRLSRSSLAGHLRASADSAYWTGVVMAGLFVAYATRGQYVAWDGVHSIPAGGAR